MEKLTRVRFSNLDKVLFPELGLTEAVQTAFISVRLRYPNCCTDEFIDEIKEISEVVEGHYTDSGTCSLQ